MIEGFFNKNAVCTRKTTASPTSSDVLTTVSQFPCVIRPVQDISKLYIENNIGREHDLICQEYNINVGDDIHVANVKYEVLGTAVYEDLEEGTDTYNNVRVTT